MLKKIISNLFSKKNVELEGNFIVAGSFNENPDNTQYWFLKVGQEGKVILDKKIGSF